jgi:hypothetical protein
MSICGWPLAFSAIRSTWITPLIEVLAQLDFNQQKHLHYFLFPLSFSGDAR